MSITHAKVSTKTDSSDTTLVRPSDWNADHSGNGLAMFNPIDYGAVYDGVTNDTTAHQNAIDAAAVDGGIVQCPPGSTKVTSLEVKAHVEVRGAGARATIFLGTAGSDIFTFTTTGTPSYMGIRDLGTNGGRRAIAYAGGGTGYACTYVTLTNLELISPSAECIYAEGAIEEWYCDNLRLSFGTYGFRHANVSTTGGNGIDKTTFRNVTCGVQSINGFRIELTVSNSVLWEDLNIIGSGQHGFYADGGIRDWVFINSSTESNGTTGKANRTTGSITSGTPTLVVASATGLVIGDPITVEEAGGDAADLQTTISNVVGTTITLAANASRTVTSNLVTNASYDDFNFNYTINYGSNISFIGGVLGDVNGFLGGGLRYAINGRAHNMQIMGVGTTGGQDVPIYLPFYSAQVISPQAVIRWPGTISNTLSGAGQNPADVARGFIVSNNLSRSRTQIASGKGSNILLALLDSNANNTGTFGSFELRKSDSGMSKLFSIDGQTGYAALASTILATGTGSPESAVTAPVGSLFLRTDGSTSTTLYVKTSGSGNTGWTAK